VRTVEVVVTPEGVSPCRLAVRYWTGSGAPPFLLVHGLASNARLWDEVAAVLAGAGHPVAAVNLRSHGESEAPPDGYDTATAAADIAAVSTALFGGPVIVVGQSWGGNVVVRFAARHPHLVAAVGLVDGGWLDLAGTFASWSACAAALRPPDIDGLPAPTLRNRMAAEHPDWSPAALAATMANLRERPDGTVVRRLSMDNHMRIVRSMWDDPPWPDLAAIAVPTLLMPALPAPGGRSAGPGEKQALVARAVAALHQSQVRDYVGGDHDLHAQQPAAVAADLLTLVAWTRGGGIDGGAAGDHGFGRDHADHDKATQVDIREGW
jgi:pimeloyl-ACP methyl ester carboxylesterase